MMDTVRLYDFKPYDREFSATITELKKDDKWKLKLDRTLFFPEEGGQSSDTGYLLRPCSEKNGSEINGTGSDRNMIAPDPDRDPSEHENVNVIGYKVIHVTIENNEIWHEIEGDCSGLKAGDAISGKIDWDRRFSNMQNHTGEHILSGILHRDFGSENTGFHLSDNIVTLDTSKALNDNELKELEARANEAVYSNIPVTCRYYENNELSGIEYRSKKTISEAVRLVTIPGIDVCACCAPHVKSTGEIGIIKIIHSIYYKGGTRLTILSGKRAYQYLAGQHEITESLSQSLSSPPQKLPDAVNRLLKEVNRYKEKLTEISKERLFQKINELPGDLRSAVIFSDDTGMNNITQRNAVNLLTERYNGICAVFTGAEGHYRFILSHPSGDARDTADILKERFQAKCGGSKEMIQGSVNACEQDLRGVLAEQE
ncbi:MAG: alanyl-tRNA editing protein [Lachnospiraceae bacterium]|nr:alanyl-tRNA editing protein [Lachnospiraceae bacterium]